MTGSRVALPRGVEPPFAVYVNGVAQAEGVDFTHDAGARELRFATRLHYEGKVATWRWIVGGFGVGTYRKNHAVDVRYTDAAGRTRLAEGLRPLDV